MARRKNNNALTRIGLASATAFALMGCEASPNTSPAPSNEARPTHASSSPEVSTASPMPSVDRFIKLGACAAPNTFSLPDISNPGSSTQAMCDVAAAIQGRIATDRQASVFGDLVMHLNHVAQDKDPSNDERVACVQSPLGVVKGDVVFAGYARPSKSGPPIVAMGEFAPPRGELLYTVPFVDRGDHYITPLQMRNGQTREQPIATAESGIQPCLKGVVQREGPTPVVQVLPS